MGRFMFQKIMSMLLTLFLVVLITFIVFEIIPGDSALIKAGMDADEATLATLREEMGLNQPLYLRFLRWISSALRGDLGTSWRFNQPVSALIASRFVVTLQLTVYALFLTILLGLPLSLLSLRYRNKVQGMGLHIFSQIGMAIPSFWLGMLMILFFGLTLKLFVPGRYLSFSENFLGALIYMLFPALALAIPRISVLQRYLRGSILDQSSALYVRTARAKGTDEKIILRRHVLRNALIPVLTILGMMTAEILGGSLIVEQIFFIPGLGRLLVMGISSRDFPLVQAMTLYMASVVVILHTLLDIIYRWIDPRIEKGEQ